MSFNFMATIIPSAVILEPRNIKNLRYANGLSFMAEREEQLRSLLMKVKELSEKASLKLDIQKTKILASGPITSWKIDGETMVTVRDYFWGAPKSLQMVKLNFYSRETKRHLFLGRKAMTNLESILKQRLYFDNKGPYSPSHDFFPVVMCGCESWTTKKSEH